MRDKNEGIECGALCYMPDGSPVPEVLTADEAVVFLRLDVNGPKHPEQTLQFYRTEGLLRGTRVGKHLRYTKAELLRFVAEQTERTNGNMS